MTDAQLFRIARILAKHESEIGSIMRDLQRSRREVRTVKSTQAAIAGSSAGASLGAGSSASVKLTAGGVQAGAAGFKGGRFTLSPRAVLGAGGTFLVFGAASVAGNMARQWNEMRDVRERLGVGEALGRIGRSQLRQLLVTPARGIAEGIGEVLEAAGGDKEAYLRRFRDLWRSLPLLGETVEEQRERRAREQAAINDASDKAVAFVDEQVLVPIRENARHAAGVVRTSREAAAIRKKLDSMNEGLEGRVFRAVYERGLKENANASD